ncbi:endodeoxyribonuclease [Savitreella phatthalungensis]
MPTAEDLSSDVQLKIEALMLDIQQDIMVNRPPKLKVDPISDQATAAGGKRKKTEAMSQYGTKTFASHVAILTYLYEALSRGLTYTTRDVFYRDPELFGSQKAVDDAIVELSNRLQVPRDALGVCAAGKGLVCGPAVGSVSDKLLDSVETRIITRPDDIVFRREHFAQIEAVLIVEKEAIFHQLTQTPVVRYLVLITGKGCEYW